MSPIIRGKLSLIKSTFKVKRIIVRKKKGRNIERPPNFGTTPRCEDRSLTLSINPRELALVFSRFTESTTQAENKGTII